MKRLFGMIALFTLVFSFSAFASDGGSIDAFLAEVLEFIKNSGGLPMQMKIAAIITLVISLTKLSILRPIWDKLGGYKVLVAPVLALAAGLVAMNPITLPGVISYLMIGAGSVAFHELLDALKGIPKLSGVVDFILKLLSKLLLGGK